MVSYDTTFRSLCPALWTFLYISMDKICKIIFIITLLLAIFFVLHFGHYYTSECKITFLTMNAHGLLQFCFVSR